MLKLCCEIIPRIIGLRSNGDSPMTEIDLQSLRHDFLQPKNTTQNMRVTELLCVHVTISMCITKKVYKSDFTNSIWVTVFKHAAQHVKRKISLIIGLKDYPVSDGWWQLVHSSQVEKKKSLSAFSMTTDKEKRRKKRVSNEHQVSTCSFVLADILDTDYSFGR